jgi:hypothetical protein
MDNKESFALVDGTSNNLVVYLTCNQADLMALKGVVGVGIGLKSTGGKLSMQKCIIVYVTKKLPENQLEVTQIVPKKYTEYVLTDVVEVGIVGDNPIDNGRPAKRTHAEVDETDNSSKAQHTVTYDTYDARATNPTWNLATPPGDRWRDRCLEYLDRWWYKRSRMMGSICVTCPRCHGSSPSTCACARQQFMESVEWKFFCQHMKNLNHAH